MINLDKFNQLSINKKFEILGDQGIFLMNRVEERREYTLYSVESFFVETLFDLDKKEIIQIKTFSKTSDLDKYLNDIYI